MGILRIWSDDLDWILLVQERIKGSALVNIVVPLKEGNFVTN
jgi:hypothetical protein